MGGPHWNNLTQFLLAIRSNDTDKANVLLRMGVDCDSRFCISSTRHPSICICVEMGHYQMVKLLLDWGCSINQTVELSGQTSLHIAASHGYIHIAHLLVHNRAQVDIHDNQGFTPLHLAAQRTSLEMVKLLVENSAGVNLRDNVGRTALIQSVCHKNSQIATFLLESGANPTAVDLSGNTVLHYAAMTSNLDPDMFRQLVKAICACGSTSTLDAVNLQGQQAVHYLSGRPQSLSKWSALESLLEAGCQVEARTFLGQTALHLATIHPADERCIGLLLSSGCPVNTRDDLGASPLLCLAREGKIGLIKMLVAAGADANAIPEEVKGTLNFEVRWFLEEARKKRVPTLMEEARRALRKHYHRHTMEVAKQIGLPSIILDFLAFAR